MAGVNNLTFGSKVVVPTSGRLLLWLDAADLNSIYLTVGNAVTGMNNKAGTTPFFMESDGSARHTINTLGNNTALDAEGDTDRRLDRPSSAGDTPGLGNQFTFFAAVRGNGDGLLDMNTGGLDITLTSVRIYGDHVDFDFGTIVTYTNSIEDNKPHILMIRWEGVGGDVEVKVSDLDLTVDGNVIGDLGSRADALQVLNDSTSSEGWDGTMGEMILYAERLVDRDANAVGRYLCQKWNMNWTDI